MASSLQLNGVVTAAKAENASRSLVNFGELNNTTIKTNDLVNDLVEYMSRN